MKSSILSIEMTYSGDPEVIQNILKKKKLLVNKDPKHEEIRTVLLLPGGGQEGVIEAGVGVALEKYELVDAFDYLVGVSTGAPVGYYILGKEVAIGTTVFFDDNVKNHFVNLLRLWKIMDIETLENVLKQKKPINIETLRKSRPKFLVAIIDKETGECKFVDVKKSEDPFSCIIAAICVPILDGGKTVLINGKNYVDGGLFNPLPITYVMENIKPTDILIVLPDPLIPKSSLLYRLWAMMGFVLSPWMNRKVRLQIAGILDRYNRELAYLTGKRNIPVGVRIGVIHPKKRYLNEITMNKKLLQEAAVSAMAFAKDLFGSEKR